MTSSPLPPSEIMGVPRLSRWMMERFPQAIRTATRDNMRGRVDNLFVDFNGLIHESMLRAATVSTPQTELELYHHIAAYLTEVVVMARPSYVFIAVDGPAPDAKIRQQRLRRIMGSLTGQSEQLMRRRQGWDGIRQRLNELIEDHLMRDGSATQPGSAGITPGTGFMRRLQSFLVAFLAKTIEDGSWGDVEVELSGFNVEGEGEHKIIQKIKQTQAFKPQDFEFKDKVEIQVTPIIAEKKKLVLTGEQVIDNQMVMMAPTTATQAKAFTNKEENPVQSNCVFGMDGDLFLLLLGLNMPEVYLMRRWQGIMVEEVITPKYAKVDPWGVGLVYVDIQTIREGIVYELLQKYIDEDKNLRELVKSLPQNQLTEAYLSLDREETNVAELSVKNIPALLKAQLLEYLIFSQTANRIIYDFIALTLFVGNDFVPEMAGQTIKLGALDKLMGFYKKNFLNNIPFKHFVDENYTLSPQYYGFMFKLIADQCEIQHIGEDFQAFQDLHKTFLNETERRKLDSDGSWDRQIKTEMRDMEEELGSNLFTRACGRQISKLSFEDSKKVVNKYRKLYYNKFHYLELEYNVNPPTEMRPQDILFLTLLDHLENLEEQKIVPNYQQQLTQFIEQQAIVLHYKGFHHVIRSYLKTLQWVVLYYLAPGGIPEWTWEYPYPFTPLSSDMATYCKLFATKDMQIEDDVPIDKKQTETQPKPEDSEDSNIEQLIKSEQVTVEVKDLIEKVHDEYVGPTFVFSKNRPKTTLQQIVFTMDRSKTGNFLPDFVSQKVGQQFFDKQPVFDEMLILDASSAFCSFTQQLNLQRKQPSESSYFSTLSYGFQPGYTVYHKNYPIGLVDGVHFHEIGEKLDEKNFSEEEMMFFNAAYARGSNILLSPYKKQDLKRYAGPGQRLQFRQDDYDVDFSTKFRSASFQPHRQFNIESHPVRMAVLDFGLDQLIKTNIYILENAPIEQQLLFSVLKSVTTEAQVKVNTQIQRYRGSHLMTECVTGLTQQRMKLNVVAFTVNGEALVADIRENLNTTTTKSEPFGNINQQQNDKFIQDMNISNSAGGALPEFITNKMQQFLELSAENISGTPVLSYFNDYYGIITGFVYQNQWCVREYKDGKFGLFENITKVLTDTYAKQRKHWDLNFSTVQESLQAVITEFCIMNQALSYPTTELIVLVAPVKFINNQFSFTTQSWFEKMMKCHPQPWRQYFREDLVPYEYIPVQPVPLLSMHRQFQRRRFMRTITPNFSLSADQVFRHDNDLTLIIDNHAESFKLTVADKQVQIDEDLARLLAYQTNKLDFDRMNTQLKWLGIQVDYKTLTFLLDSVTIKLNDSSMRQLGLQAENNAYLKTNNEFNRIAELIILVAIYQLRQVFVPLIKALNQIKKKNLQLQEIFPGLKPGGEFKQCTLEYSIDGFDSFMRGKIESEADAVSALSAAMYFLHSVINPLSLQNYLFDGEMHVPMCLMPKILREVEHFGVEPANVQATTPVKHYQAEVDRVCFIKQHRCLGIVVCVGDGQIRAVTAKRLMNYNYGYQGHTVFVGAPHELVMLQEKVEIVNQFMKTRFDLPDVAQTAAMKVDLTKPLHTWLQTRQQLGSEGEEEEKQPQKKVIRSEAVRRDIEITVDAPVIKSEAPKEEVEITITELLEKEEKGKKNVINMYKGHPQAKKQFKLQQEPEKKEPIVPKEPKNETKKDDIDFD